MFFCFQGGLEPSADATALAAASKAEAEAGGADMRSGAAEVPVLDPKVGLEGCLAFMHTNNEC